MDNGNELNILLGSLPQEEYCYGNNDDNQHHNHQCSNDPTDYTTNGGGGGEGGGVGQGCSKGGAWGGLSPPKILVQHIIYNRIHVDVIVRAVPRVL